jgi:hypothetical protein
VCRLLSCVSFETTLHKVVIVVSLLYVFNLLLDQNSVMGTH